MGSSMEKDKDIHNFGLMGTIMDVMIVNLLIELVISAGMVCFKYMLLSCCFWLWPFIAHTALFNRSIEDHVGPTSMPEISGYHTLRVQDP